jgi:hypothetical protein
MSGPSKKRSGLVPEAISIGHLPEEDPYGNPIFDGSLLHRGLKALRDDANSGSPSAEFSGSVYEGITGMKRSPLTPEEGGRPKSGSAHGESSADSHEDVHFESKLPR